MRIKLMDPADSLYFVAGLLALLLSISEWLGWSTCQINSVSEAIIALLSSRKN